MVPPRCVSAHLGRAIVLCISVRILENENLGFHVASNNNVLDRVNAKHAGYTFQQTTF